MGRDCDLENKQGSTTGLGASDGASENYVSLGRRVPIILRQSALSKGVRIYWHSFDWNSGAKRYRSSYNYAVGIQVVKMLVKWTQLKIVAIGTEEGAMCIHYKTI